MAEVISAVGIPLLSKAVDFLFEEGKKIIQEIRERKNTSSNIGIPDAEVVEPITPAPIQEINSNDVITTKNDALSHEIERSVWLNSEKEIKHLIRLLEIDTRSYYLAQEQYKMYGRALVPPIILNRLIESEKGVEKTTKLLTHALSKIYDKKIIIHDTEEA